MFRFVNFRLELIVFSCFCSCWCSCSSRFQFVYCLVFRVLVLGISVLGVLIHQLLLNLGLESLVSCFWGLGIEIFDLEVKTALETLKTRQNINFASQQ